MQLRTYGFVFVKQQNGLFEKNTEVEAYRQKLIPVAPLGRVKLR